MKTPPAPPPQAAPVIQPPPPPAPPISAVQVPPASTTGPLYQPQNPPYTPPPVSTTGPTYQAPQNPPYTPSPAYVPPAPVIAEPASYAPAAPPAARPMSPVVVAIGSGAGVLLLLGLLYFYLSPKSASNAGSVTPAASSTATSGPTHPLAKYLEISGVRLAEAGAGQMRVHFMVINHSPADLPDLQARITLNAGGKPMFEFPTAIPSIGPYESKDLHVTLKTSLHPYEWPDWQAVKPVLQITSAP